MSIPIVLFWVVKLEYVFLEKQFGCSFKLSKGDKNVNFVLYGIPNLWTSVTEALDRYVIVSLYSMQQMRLSSKMIMHFIIDYT